MNDNTRILIVDDHALLRGTLRGTLERESGLEVVGTAGCAEDAVEQALVCDPTVLLMDIDMPGLNCFDAAERITHLRPDVRIVFLSAFFHDHYIEEALRVRASGYLTKREPPETVVAAIREVAAGGAYFSTEIRERIVVDGSGAKLTGAGQSRASTLSPRETEVLRYIAGGLSKKEIAGTMRLSIKTVDRHATNLMTKLDIHDRVDLARFAIREGIADA